MDVFLAASAPKKHRRRGGRAAGEGTTHLRQQLNVNILALGSSAVLVVEVLAAAAGEIDTLPRKSGARGAAAEFCNEESARAGHKPWWLEEQDRKPV